MKFASLLLALAFALPVHALDLFPTEAQVTSEIRAIANKKLGGIENGAPDQLVLEKNPFFGDSASWPGAYKRADRLGDAYFLIGNLDEDWSKDEYTRFYTIARWLVNHGFRVILNPAAYEVDVREAVQNPNASIIIWSSHGATDGEIFDAASNALPRDTFNTHVGAHLKQIIHSNCYGEETVNYYPAPKSITRRHWTGTTTTPALFNYLISDQWNADIEEDLGIKLK